MGNERKKGGCLKTLGVMTGLGIMTSIGLLYAANEIKKDNNPTYYEIPENREDSACTYFPNYTEDLESKVFPGEKRFEVGLTIPTKERIQELFQDFYTNKHSGTGPEIGEVSEDDIVEFTGKYVGERLQYRWPVGLPPGFVHKVRKIPVIGEGLMPRKSNEYF